MFSLQVEPAPRGGTGVNLLRDALNAVEADRHIVVAVLFPIADQPSGARGGRLLDPYGIQWLLQAPVSVTAQSCGVNDNSRTSIVRHRSPLTCRGQEPSERRNTRREQGQVERSELQGAEGDSHDRSPKMP